MIFTAHFLWVPEILHDHGHMIFTARFPWVPENVFTCPVYSKSTRFNPYIGWLVLHIIMPVKVGIKSCRFARICAYMDINT